MAVNVIPDSALKAAAHALATSMPVSTWPIGPQLEAWVLLMLGGALKAHASVAVVPPGPFFIRKNQKKAFKGPKTSWLEITSRRGHAYEIHNALQVRGWSGAHHEVDVCLIRATPSVPPIPAWEFVAGVECKQHQAAVQENVVRALLGVRLEIGVAHPTTRRWHRQSWAIASTNVAVSANTSLLMHAYCIDFIGVDVLTLSHVHPGITHFAAKVASVL